MRHPIRPFIREFKARSSNTSLPTPQTGDEKATTDTRRFFSSLAESQDSNHSAEYLAALKAADEAFGKAAPTDALQSGAMASAPITGRILP